MNNQNEEKTVIFTPVEEEQKETITEELFLPEEEIRDEIEKEDGGKKTILILSAILVLIVATIIILVIAGSSSDKEKTEKPQKAPQENTLEEDVPFEEEEIPDQAVVIEDYKVIFYANSAVKSGEGYIITAALPEDDKENKLHLFVDEATDIRLNGQRIDLKSFFYLLEEKSEENLTFDCKLDRQNEYVVSISFEGELNKEEEEPEGVVIEEEEESSSDSEIILEKKNDL